jgi:error-prone DNA polymerase
MTLPERVVADYKNADMSVGPHPMRFFRRRLQAEGILSAMDLDRARDGSRARVAGLVQTRQRPMTAKGFFIITLEDETGFANLIVTPQMFEAHRALLVRAAGLIVHGVVQNVEGVVHLRGDHFEGLEVRANEVAVRPRVRSFYGRG